jgi:zinc protease
MHFLKGFPIFLLFGISQILHAQNSPENIETFTLKNGMKIIVWEDHSIPNANMYLFYRVGSRNEYPGITGISHFFEHMMFNGAKKYGPKEFDRVMEANGGSNNAYTTKNLTVYTDWFPGNALETMFDLEADRIQFLDFDSAIIESERGVVLSERSTGLENSNFEQLGYEVNAAAFYAHPYHWPVIGYESDMKNWTKADLQQYFKTYYAPNNCVVVIVGDVKTDEVKKLAKQYFEPIPASDPPRKIHTVEPPQQGERRVFVNKQAATQYMIIGYHIPESAHPDYYALDLLNVILSNGKSSKLYRDLVDDKQLALYISSYMPKNIDPGIFPFYVVAAHNASTDSIEASIYRILDNIAENGVTLKELEKAKNIQQMDMYRSLETINGKANTVGTYEMYFGDYNKVFNAPELYDAVTIDDIKRVVKTYFNAENRTVGILNNKTAQTNE